MFPLMSDHAWKWLFGEDHNMAASGVSHLEDKETPGR